MRINPITNPYTKKQRPRHSFGGGTRKELELMQEIKTVVQEPSIRVRPYALAENIKDIPTYNEIMSQKEENQIASYLENKKIEFIRNFDGMTITNYKRKDSSNEEKLKAFDIAYTFYNEHHAQPSTKTEHIKSLDLTLNLGHTAFSEEQNEKIFDVAKKHWQTTYLPIMLENEKQKALFVAKALKNMPLLKGLKNFDTLSVEDKYFVAKYYENNGYKKFKDDPMYKILTDFTIKDKTEVFDEIRKKIKLDSEVFNEKLNSLPELIQSEEGLNELDGYILNGANSDNEKSLLTHLFLTLNKNALSTEPKQKQLEFLNTQPEQTIQNAVQKIRNDWYEKAIPTKVEKEVMFQAYKTDIQVKTYQELVKINKQLESINIKLDKISITLSDFVANMERVTSKFPSPVEDSMQVQKEADLKMDSLKFGLSMMNESEQTSVLNSFKTEGMKYLDLLSKNAQDKASRVMLNDLKSQIQTATRPNAVIQRLESYGTLAVMNNLMHSHASTQTAAQHTINSSMNPDFSKPNLDASGGSSGLLASVMNPKALVIAAVVAGLYAIYSSRQTNKQYNDMYFGQDI